MIISLPYVNVKDMKKRLFYILALVLSIIWIIGFFFIGAGLSIHCIIVIAVLSFLQGVICNPPCYKKDPELKLKTLNM
jgi:hypothetical protein